MTETSAGIKLLTGVWIKELLRNFKNFKANKVKFFISVFIAVFFVLLFYIGFYRLIAYVKSTPVVGSAIVFRLLSTVFTALLILLLYSSVITAFSTLYFSRDNEFVFLCPLHVSGILLSRLVKNTFLSGWMSFAVILPLLAALGMNYRFHPAGYFFILINVFLFMTSISCLGMTVAAAVVKIFPARKVRDLMAAGLVVIGTALYMVFRVLNVEQLLRPGEGRRIIEYLNMLEIPRAVYLPSYWLSRSIISWLRADRQWIGATFVLAAFAAAGMVVYYFVLRRFFFSGWEKVHSEEKKRYEKKTFPSDPVLRKDIRTFFRDTRQWIQLMLTASLVAIYLFNIYHLPLEIIQLRYIVVILNTVMICFVAAAVGLRFSFCSLSLEGGGVWLLLSSPVDLKRVIKKKYMENFIPVMVMSALLIFISNLILQASGPLAAATGGFVLLTVFSLNCLAMGMGCLYPRFDASSPPEIETSPGGVLYMVISFLFIALSSFLGVLAGRAHIFYGSPQTAALYGGAVVILNFTVAYFPLRMGVKNLRKVEFTF